MQAPALIGLDWGTSSCRAWLMAATGDVLARNDTCPGILAVPGGDFDAAFEALVGPWLAVHPDLPVLASGMITSRNGWVETPYLPLPVTVQDLAQSLTPHRTAQGRLIHFITGIATGLDRLPDVMRGEETELVGHIVGNASGSGVFVMPGTHSKWARADDGAIQGFETFMTGEFYAILHQHSILGRLAVDGAYSPEAFLSGVRASAAQEGSLLSRAFSARTLTLFNRLAADQIGDYLSGILIGEEIAAGLAAHPPGAQITIIGRGDLAERYRIALHGHGCVALSTPPGLARRGHVEIARQAGMLA
ncbi:MAG: 2-dehydro-3-deoxygalactonokinase [Pseudomonadota bacterium]